MINNKLQYNFSIVKKKYSFENKSVYLQAQIIPN